MSITTGQPSRSNESPDLLIVGASARAAAFSALRAGLRPYCVDRFADVDLQARCRCEAMSAPVYRTELVNAIQSLPRCPWMYVGGMENRPRLIQEITRQRALWGNDSAALSIVRAPRKLHRLLLDEGLRSPVVFSRSADVPDEKRWLAKPLRSSGGTGINYLTEHKRAKTGRGFYFQEYIPGDNCSAAYVTNGRQARLLGVTRQLIGQDWLHADGFQYCGSIGPIPTSSATLEILERIGRALAEVGGLRGLFGVDFVLQGDIPWPVEVNPRYTSSMEVLEFGSGVPVVALHRCAFEPAAPIPAPARRHGPLIGKAIYFTPRPLKFPRDGPWTEYSEVESMSNFADIPRPGVRIDKCQPVLSFFCRGACVADCVSALREKAHDLDRWLLRH